MDKKKALTSAVVGIGAAAAGITAKNYQDKKRNEKAAGVDGNGQTVLITGGTSGIGKQLAFIFAEHHFNLVLASRNEDRLFEMKLEIENSYDVEVETIRVDLSKEGAAKELYDAIREKDITIDQFVNNAGAGRVGNLVETDPERIEELIMLNVTNPTLLCRYIGADMVERGDGKILNVSSMSSFAPDPGLNVYGATKAYMRFLTEAMCGELEHTGVTVTALCPGATRTEFSANAGRKDSKHALSAELVAKEGFAGMQNGELIVIPSAQDRALKVLSDLAPEKAQIRAVKKYQEGLRE